MTDRRVNPGVGSPPTSITLLERVRARDQKAWERFVHLYSPLVYDWCRQAGLQEADAADVGQEVFRAVAGAIGGFRHDRQGDTFRGWLRTITRNKVHDFRRRCQAECPGTGGSDAQQRLQEIEEQQSSNSDEAGAAKERLLVYRRIVELVLADNEERTRQVFWRVVVEQQQPADVAGDLGISVNAVYLAKSRVLRRIREELAGLEELP